MTNRIRQIIIVLSLILVFAVLSFTGGLNIASFQKNYTESLISSYAVSGGETVRKIEYAVKYGKPLNNFYGIDHLLQGKIDDSNELKEVLVISNDGTIIYNQDGEVKNKKLQGENLEKSQFKDSSSELNFSYHISDGDYHVYLPIKDRDQVWIGSVGLVFSEEIVKEKTNFYLMKLVIVLIVLTAVVALALLFIFPRAKILTSDNRIIKKNLLIVLLTVLGLVQIIYGVVNYHLFKNAYIDIAKENTSFTSIVIKNDLESVVEKGVAYQQLFGIEDYLQKVVDTVHEIDEINLLNANEEILYSTTNLSSHKMVPSEYLYRVELIADSTGAKGTLNVGLSKSYLDNKLFNIILDTVTVIVTSFLFTVELTLFLLIVIHRQLGKNAAKDFEKIQETETDVTVIRPLSFIVLFSIFLTASFIPIVMKNLYEPMFGLSESFVIALPITMEMLFAGLSTLLAGYIIDNKGWRPVFLLGVLILAIGTILSGLSTSGLMFIIARAITGAGYGFSLMAMRGFVNVVPSEEERTKGFSANVSGLFAGINCGVIVGAMLADRIGYSLVFFVAFSTLVLAGIFSLIFMKNSKKKAKVLSISNQDRMSNHSSLFAFFLNKKVLGFFLLILIPTAAISMFLDYYFPLFANTVGASTSDVGRAFLLNGLCVVYLGPFLSKYTLKYLGSEKSILLSGIIVAAAMLSFSWSGTLMAGFIAAILLGVAESFGLAAQNNYFVKLDATQTIGVGKALGFQGNIKKIGQMSGPMIFGGATLFGILGIGVIGLSFLLILIIFFLTVLRDRKMKSTAASGGEM